MSSAPVTGADLGLGDADVKDVVSCASVQESGDDVPSPSQVVLEQHQLRQEEQAAGLALDILNQQLVKIDERKKRLIEKGIDDELLERKVFELAVAVVDNEFFLSLPGIPDITLWGIAKENKVGTAKVGNRRVVYGSVERILATKNGLFQYMDDQDKRKQLKDLEGIAKGVRSRIRQAGRPRKKKLPSGKPQLHKVKQEVTEGSEESNYRTPATKKAKRGQNEEEAGDGSDADADGPRRSSRRLSGKPKRSFLALHHGEDSRALFHVKQEPQDDEMEVGLTETGNHGDEAMETTEAMPDVVEIVSEFKKRGRGRPRKVLVEDGGGDQDQPRDASIAGELPGQKEGELQQDVVQVRKRGRPRKVLNEQEPLGNNVCRKCGFRSTSVSGLRSHQRNYHSKVLYECDICLKLSGYRYGIDKHRETHFSADGRLTESAIVLHKAALKNHGREEETLTPDLQQFITEYDAEQEQRAGEALEAGGAGEASGEQADAAVVKVEQELFECQLCGAKLNSAAFLKQHVKGVHLRPKKRASSLAMQSCSMASDDKKIHCPHCSFVCFRVQNMTRHLQCHRKPPFYRCDHCDYTNKKYSEVLRHKRNKHNKKELKCEFCGSRHRNKVLLSMHVRKQHQKLYSVMCELCGRVFITKFQMKKHLKMYHGKEEDRPGRVMCNKCGRIVPSQKMLIKHIQEFHSEEGHSKEEKTVSDGVEVLQNNFCCKYCKYTNKISREVRRHIVRMHMERSHKCDQCDKMFPVEKMLTKHVRVAHLGIEKKKCHDCSKWFRNAAYLAAHIKRIHVGERPFECDVCHKTFYEKRNFEYHKETHLPEEERSFKFTCELCGKKYKYRASYDYHMTEHTGEKAFDCTVCGKKFRDKPTMERHLVTHCEDKPFKCGECGKEFKLKKYLDVHALTHAGDKYACTLCWKVFGHKQLLDSHKCKFVVGRDVAGVPPPEIINRYVVADNEALSADPISLQPVYGIDLGRESGSAAATTVPVEDLTYGGGTQRYLCASCGTTFSEMSDATEHKCPAGIAVEDQAGRDLAAQINGTFLDENKHEEDSEDGAQEDEEDKANVEYTVSVMLEDGQTIGGHGTNVSSHKEQHQRIGRPYIIPQSSEAVSVSQIINSVTPQLFEASTLGVDKEVEAGYMVIPSGEIDHQPSAAATQGALLSQHQSEPEAQPQLQLKEEQGPQSGPTGVPQQQEEEHEEAEQEEEQEEVEDQRYQTVVEGELGMEEAPSLATEQPGAAPQVEMYMCGLCNSLFASQTDINLHLQQHSVVTSDAAAVAGQDASIMQQASDAAPGGYVSETSET